MNSRSFAFAVLALAPFAVVGGADDPPARSLAELNHALAARKDATGWEHDQSRFEALSEYVAQNPDAPDAIRARIELVELGDAMFRSADVVANADALLARELAPAERHDVELLAVEALGRVGRVDDAKERVKPLLADADPNRSVGAALRYAELLINARELAAARAVYESLVEAHDDANLQGHVAARSTELDRIGTEAPRFDATAVDGTSISSDRLSGKVVLVQFWATTCEHSKEEFPTWKRAWRQWHERGFEIVGVCLDPDGKGFDVFLLEHGLDWRQVRDGKGWDGPLVEQFGVAATPSNVLIDRTGRIARVDLRGRSLGNALAFLLGE